MKLAILKRLDKIVGFYLNLASKKTPSTSPIPLYPKKIAIIKLSAMGDVLCLMPAIRQLREWQPQAEITFITTQRSNPSLFQNLSFFNHLKLLPTSPPSLINFIHDFKKQHYDLCIDADQYYNISTWLALHCHYAIGFQTKAKPHRLTCSLTYDTHDNEKKQFIKLIALACNQAPPTIFDMTLPELITSPQQNTAQQKLLPYLNDPQSTNIIIYPGSSGNADFRRWHINNYKQIINSLCKQGHSLYIAGGPDELAIKEKFLDLTKEHSNCHNLINELSLTDWLYFMQHYATLFVGNDAGLLHIAEAAGTPIIGIFGPNIYSKWGSLNPQSIGIEIPITNLTCRPCIVNSSGQIPQQCQRGDNACLTRITATQVLTKINNKLQAISMDDGTQDAKKG